MRSKPQVFWGLVISCLAVGGGETPVGRQIV